MSLPSGSALHRRTLTRAAVWSVPVIATATAAPADAVSACGTTPLPVSTTTAATTAPAQGYTRTSSTAATWRTNDPDGAVATYAPAQIAITETRSSTNILFGFQTNDSQNLTPYTAGTVSGVTINQRPAVAGTTGSPRGYANRTTTTFAFDRDVYNLTFTIADISNSGSTTSTPPTVAFWDAVALSGGTYTVTSRGARVAGAGTVASPFSPPQIYDNADTSDQWNVTVQFTSVVRTLTLEYWSATAPTGYTDSRGGQGITVSNMTMAVRPAGC